MNFLALANTLKSKCRVQGAPMGAVTGQTADYQRLIGFVNEAWMDLQRSRENWNWMRTTAQFPTVNGQALYTIANIGLTDFGNWADQTFRLWDTAAGQISEQFLFYLNYETWRDRYQFGAFRTTLSQPLEVTVAPNFAIGLGPVPLAGYTILGDYYREPSEMVDPGDVPALPARYHMLIVYKAMMLYGATEAASEVYQDGENSSRRVLNQMAINQLQTLEMGPALA